MKFRNLVFVAVAAGVLALVPNFAGAVIIGGWDATRGGPDGAIQTGSAGTMLRSELAANFPGATLADSPYLSTSFLNSIDVLYIIAVHDAFDQITPLDATEQGNLANWVAGGGRALLVTDNPSFVSAGDSMVNHFGVLAEGGGLDGRQLGTVTDNTDFPTITNGPFGPVTTFEGGYTGAYNILGSATSLGGWNANNQTALAALNYGSGRVVFYADESMMGDFQDGSQNPQLLGNVLTFLSVPEPSSFVLSGIGLLGLLAAAQGTRRIEPTALA
jgi:hypothetical protein